MTCLDSQDSEHNVGVKFIPVGTEWTLQEGTWQDFLLLLVDVRDTFRA